MKIYIYTLKHPITLEVRYVGKTKSPKRRLSEHLSKPLLKKKNTHLAFWILSLFKKKLKPIMEIIDETEGDWGSLEKKWVKKFPNLCNHTEGGEGCHGHKQTDEHKENIRKAMLGKNKGKKMPKKAIKEMVKKRRERNKDPEKRTLKYTIEQIKQIKKALLTNNCKACIARELKVNNILVYEIANGSKYKDVLI